MRIFSRGSHVGAIIGINLTILMATLDMSIVNISLPTLVTVLDTDFATIQWVILSYILVLTCLMLSVSRLGDLFDKRRLFLAGLVLFTLASLWCGLAPGVGWLIGFRALQGVGAAVTQALGLAIVADIVPRERLGGTIGLVGGTVSLGLASGPPLGGLLIGLYGWRLIFLLNVPLGIVSWLLLVRTLPSSRPQGPRERFDFAGAGVLFVSLGCYCLGMTMGQNRGFSDPLVGSLLAAAVAGGALFLAVEKKTADPMLDLSLFKNVLFTLSLVMGVLVFISLAGNVILPFFLQSAKGYSTERVGLLIMTMPLCMGVVAPVAGRLSDAYGPRILSLAGLLVVFAGCLALATITEETTATGFVLRVVPFGLGMGIFQSPNNAAVMSAAPANRRGVASGLLNYSRTLGQTTGVPLIGAVFSAQVAAMSARVETSNVELAAPEVLSDAVAATYGYTAVLIGLTVLVAAVAFAIDRRARARTR